MDGAFFSQPDLQVPEEVMPQYARYDVMVPAWKFAYLVLIHAQIGFGFFKALLNGPAETAQPDKCWESCAHRRIADEIIILGIASERSPDDQPEFFLRQPLKGKPDPATGEFINDRSLGPLGNFAPVPEK